MQVVSDAVLLADLSLAQPDNSEMWRAQPPPQASPGFLRMLEDALHAEEQGRPFGGMHRPLHCRGVLVLM